MPELPEVNNFARIFEAAALHQTIREVEVHDDYIIRNMDGDTFAERLAGRTITGSLRRGKYLFAQLDNGHDLLLHFGMTGDLNFYENEEDRSRYERFVLIFSTGQRLGFDDPRKFARILYLEDRAAYIEEIKLGPDALVVTDEELEAAMTGRKTTIKALLLNQSILAGVGNLYADEICYRAGIRPDRRLDTLTDEERKQLIARTHDTMGRAAAEAPYYKDYPPNWFWKVWRHEGRDCDKPDCGGSIARTKVAGRTTMFCATCQA